MENIKSATGLEESILQLESKWSDDGKMLKEQFHIAFDSMKPINLIKSTLREAVHSRDLKSDIVNTSVGLTAGYLSKIAFASVVKTPMTKFLGNALMLGITRVVARHPEKIKSLGNIFLKLIRSKSAGKAHAFNNSGPSQITP